MGNSQPPVASSYAEISAKLPKGAGYWPGFWLLTSEFTERKPQLFVMEARGDNPGSVFHRYNFTDASGTFQPSEFMRTGGNDFFVWVQAIGFSQRRDNCAVAPTFLA